MMSPRDWVERQFWARAAFTFTFFIIAAILYFYYRILNNPLLFPGNPWLSIGLPAFVIALMVSFGVGRAVKRGQIP